MQHTIEYNGNLGGHEITVTDGKGKMTIVVFAALERIGTASVLDVTGQQADVVRIFEWLMKHNPTVMTVTDQVHRDKELRAMYKAGFRYIPADGSKVPKLNDTVHNLMVRKSIMLTWERAKQPK